MAHLPKELLDMIESHLSSPFVNPDPEPSPMVPGSSWRDALIQKNFRLGYGTSRPISYARGAPKHPETVWENLGRGSSGNGNRSLESWLERSSTETLTINTTVQRAALALENRRVIFLIIGDLAGAEPPELRMEKCIGWKDADGPEKVHCITTGVTFQS